MKKIFKIFNKGFTLIELLAVIVVLAVILAISVPRVLNVIEETEKEAFRITGESLIKGATDRLVLDMGDVVESRTYTISGGSFVDDSIPVTGELPEKGIINVTSQGLTSIAISNNKWCARKEENEEKIIVSKDPNCIINVPEVVLEDCFIRTNDGVQVTITDYDNSCSKNVVIPDILDGLPVKILGSSSFSLNQLTSVTIPNSVTTIRDFAFYQNRLSSLNIPNSVTTISSHAFCANLINKLSIPYGVITIGTGAFRDNIITGLSISNSVTKIEGHAFNNNLLPDEISFIYARNSDGSENKSISVSYGGIKRDGVIIPNNVTIIGNGTFFRNDLNSVTIHNAVTSIERTAFLENNLTTINIPSSVLSIGAQAFRHNRLSNLIIPHGLVSIDSLAFSSNLLTNISIPSTVTTMNSEAFNLNLLPDNQAFIYARNSDGSENNSILISYGGAKKNNVVIPNTVTTIEKFALSSCEIASITIPNSVTVIGGSAFSNNNLKSITIPNGVNSLGPTTFGYNQLTSVTIPTNVTIQTNSISQTFYNTYNPQKQAGTYTAPNQDGTWTKQP